MTAKTPKRPRDPNQLAKMVIDIATGQPEADEPALREVDRAKVKAGKLRAEKLSTSRRSEIAREAARARWSKR